MSRADGARHVSIFNSRPDFIEALRVALEADGFTASCAHLADIQSGALDLLGFIERHRPKLIVYDLPRPYESHWNVLRLLKDTRSLQGVVWVLTTTDKAALEAAVGAAGVVEIIFGEPYGVADVVTAVRKRFPREMGDSVMTAGGRPLAPGVLGSVHVLVVDDSSEVLEMLVEILETSGARVTACGTAKQAVEILEQERPDVLLSDLQMPRHDGLWLIEQVRRLPSSRGGATPAACLTGLTEPEDRARVLRAGYQYHIPKPIRPERLLGIVALLALKP